MGKIYINGIPFENTSNPAEEDVHLKCDWETAIYEYEDDVLKTLYYNAIEVEKYEIAGIIKKRFNEKNITL